MEFYHETRGQYGDSGYCIQERHYDELYGHVEDLLEQFYVISEPDMDTVDDALEKMAKLIGVRAPKRNINVLNK